MMRWKIAQFFERKWWKSYLKNKDPEDYLVWKQNYWTELIDLFGHKAEHLVEPILDVGCGPAGIFINFPHSDVVAVDPLIDSYIEDGHLDTGKYPQTRFVSKAFEDFKPEEKFNTIFCLNAINHFKDLELSFKLLSEMAAPESRIFLSIDAHKYKFLKRVFAFLQFDILHPHQYTLEEYIEFLEKYNFQIVDKKLKEKHSVFDYWVLELKMKVLD